MVGSHLDLRLIVVRASLSGVLFAKGYIKKEERVRMPTFEFIVYERKGRIVYITLNRPESSTH